MIHTEELTKLYYSIGEVAEMFDVNTSLIRFWEKEFKTIQPKKNRKGNRMFTPKDIENLRVIYHLLKERGFTIEGAKKKLKDNKEETFKTTELVSKLQYVRSELEKIKKQLDK
jgi:DNA-binding transcriptional MerR regulator